MTPVQMKMARAAVGWGVRELAEAAGVTANTVTRIENGADSKQSTVAALRKALEDAGVVFIPENGGGAGVRMRKRTALDHDAVKVKIADLDAKAEALKHDGTPSPDNAMKTMKRAVVKNEATKLRNKLVKAKGKPG